MNIPAGDAGGELDPHGADGNGNPIGGLVFSSAFGSLAQMHEWTNFMSASEFCFRACKDAPGAPALCNHIYDTMGCEWNMPANYNAGTFEDCLGDSGDPMGVYGGSTFQQGQAATPDAHPAPASSQCSTFATISNGAVASTTGTSSTSKATTTSGIKTSTTGSKSSSHSGPTATSSSAAQRGATPGANGFATIALGVSGIAALFGAVLLI